MGKVAAYSMVLLATSLASAQAKVDRVPAIVAPQELPVRPSPSEEISDAPSSENPRPEFIQQVTDPPTKLTLGAPDSDTLKGHVLPYAGLGYAVGFGHIDSLTPARGTLSSGPEIALGFGYGLTRNVDVGIGATFTPVDGGSDCSNCSAKSVNSIAYVGYHLVQGTKFDPWVRFGIGISTLHLTTPISNFNYVGMSWANAIVGGDWFATRQIGIGPVLALAFQSFVAHPTGHSTSIVEQLTIGFRVTIDANGR